MRRSRQDLCLARLVALEKVLRHDRHLVLLALRDDDCQPTGSAFALRPTAQSALVSTGLPLWMSLGLGSPLHARAGLAAPTPSQCSMTSLPLLLCSDSTWPELSPSERQ